MDPFFSIIIPIYNKEEYLMGCVKSIKDQDFTDYEIILVDDGSTDESGEICEKIAENDRTIRVIHQENSGAAAARNTGLEFAKGKYILFVDADDFWCRHDFLSGAFRLIGEEESDEIIYGMKKQYEDKEISEAWIDGFSRGEYEQCADRMRYLMEHNMIQSSACTKILRRDVIEKEKLRFVSGQLAEDIEWNLKVMLSIKTISVMPEAYYVYRQVKNSASHSSSIRHIMDMAEMIQKYAAVEIGEKERKEYILHYLANQYLQWMTVTNYVNSPELKECLQKMRQYYYLLDYNWYPYVRKARKVKWVGFYALRKLLGYYRKMSEARKGF